MALRVLSAALLWVLLPVAACGPPRPEADATTLASPGDAETCLVQSVTDGDTLRCRDGRRIRLLLIDAPELTQGPFGVRAREALAVLAPPGITLAVELDVQPQDQYGRVLAYLSLPDGRMLNEELLRGGFAVVAVYPPNVRHVERFREVSAGARAERVGLWAADAFRCLPADHRAGRCEGE
jgi:endonuclease YncB( thermonuclease family)